MQKYLLLVWTFASITWTSFCSVASRSEVIKHKTPLRLQFIRCRTLFVALFATQCCIQSRLSIHFICNRSPFTLTHFTVWLYTMVDCSFNYDLAFKHIYPFILLPSWYAANILLWYCSTCGPHPTADLCLPSSTVTVSIFNGDAVLFFLSLGIDNGERSPCEANGPEEAL